ncbi:beta-N-acetylglucosaminidase domain-containing protein [Streptomyces scopuliridis]|uniref:Beta-N-acetylglucosaminidase domain-containing protein n=1 Tax=Streptomyces scopuliridis TaxID=452529 RepID=A0ACD4ZQ76_9ACTN|nr:beta-N-acetylglucosaminidase domain-containing protein [Streptomyces scopuliridis]WSC00144.1 beta-N-acetylglucosaminidase domain-containing protein [Streptomyces scopuliridis]WSC06246.1 beta-N-acetylglucosaminidase domain-containing protein [Streptomyces scopuliridis]
MQLGRRKRTATAVAVAVIGGLLGTAPSAPAAPQDPGSPAATTPDRKGGAAVPAVWPRPQTIRAAGSAVALGDEVTVVAGADADTYAVQALADLLRAAGVRTVHTASSPGTPSADSGPVILAGGSGAQNALRALRAPERADLPSGGYRIAVGTVAGRGTVALDGVGEDGLFHAAQTLRQLIVRQAADRPAVPGVVVRDWPGTAIRGTTEGFYGQPWDHRQRLAQLDFMGRTKQNRYLYAPGDDPYRQARWRDPYPAAQRAEFRELAERARRNHVTLAWAVSPAQSICMTSDADLKALTRKIDAMWALGVRAFQLQFQDVSYSEWHCDQDAETFGSGPGAAAEAQARVANAVAGHLAGRYGGAEPLTVMPTEYYQDGATDYRTALAGALDARVQVAWTGVGVVPRTITGRELMGARAAFKHPLVTMDNYPVNDYEQDRLFLGPYTGREPAVATGSVALLANAMEQASASRIPLFTAADYAWNPRGYQPQESWRAAINDLAGQDKGAREALGALAGNDASSILSPSESAYLKPLLDTFWRSRTSTDTADRSAAASRLRAAFTVMREAPQRLSGAAGGQLDDEVRPWLDQLARYGTAGELAVDMLRAQDRGDGAAAWRASVDLEPLREAAEASRVTVGDGVLGPFLERTAKESSAWTGADRAADGAGAGVAQDARSYTVELGRARPLEAVNTMTEPGTGTGASVEARVPGQGWRALGPLSTSGWTESDAKGLNGLRVDAVRIVWPGADAGAGAGAGPGGPSGVAPSVRHVVPWFADEPQASLDLPRGAANAQIGGEPETVEARLAAQRPGEVRGALKAKPPSGIRVTVPKETTVPRGSRTNVPVKVSVPEGTPAGTYEVPLTFAGEERTLTVRAAPLTGGPDLARTGTATSSADETPDFPAAAALDGDPVSRWSSPVEDGAWWQVELARPARVGQVVLHWQEAYASRYRIQVSADGRTWRTAAAVGDGGGGRETVGMDARDARFVRVQGEGRGTRFGYSLFSVEVYGVAPPGGAPPG